MKGWRDRWVAAILIVLLLAISAGFWLARPHDRPPLALLTALPIIWGETDVPGVLQGRSAPSLSYLWLQKRHRVVPLDVLDPAALSPHKLLLIAQPRALAPTELVALDDWVRAGGHVLILTDPWLGWPSSLAIGDPRRAPTLALLDPLLTHWGVVLEAPREGDENEVERVVDGRLLRTTAPGWLRATDSECLVGEGDLTATCTVGEGQALIVADADLLSDAHWRSSRNDAILAGWLDRVSRKTR